MSRLWLIELASFNDEVWSPVWCYYDYNDALLEARKLNFEERSRGHCFRYRVTDVICSDHLVKV